MIQSPIISTFPPGPSAERPEWPNQIRTPEELPVGTRFRCVHSHLSPEPSETVYEVVDFRHDSELDESKWIYVRSTTWPQNYPQPASLADRGVIPYDGDNGPAWNQTNYIVRADS